MTEHTRYLVTTAHGETVDLTLAKELRSNNLYPFGLHNYAIYRTPEGVHVKGTNTGNVELMLDHYVVVGQEEAQNYVHPHRRLED